MHAMTVFFHFHHLPATMQDFPGEGWPMFARVPELDPAPVSMGSFNTPRTFHTTIQPTDAQGRILEGWVLTLLFEADPEEQTIVLAGAVAGGIELPDLLDLVRRERPLRWWQRRALMSVVADVGERAAVSMFYGDEDPWVGPEAERIDAESAAWLTAHNRASESYPLGRRRNRVTRQLLEQVAEVYKIAAEAGEPPTQTVAERFGRPHSTAAKWVARARKEGLIDPVGSDEGEKS